MNNFFLTLLLSPLALFGAASSSSVSANPTSLSELRRTRATSDRSSSAKLTEQKKVGPFRVSAFDTNSYYLQTHSWPAFVTTEAGSIAVLLKKGENPNVSMTLGNFTVPFVTKMPFSLVQPVGVGTGGILELLKMATAQQIVDFSSNMVYGKTAATQIAVLLNWGGTLYAGSGEMKPEQCSGVPYLDKVEELGDDITSCTLRLLGSKDGDGSPRITLITSK